MKPGPLVIAVLVLTLADVEPAAGQTNFGDRAIDRLSFPELIFQPPTPTEHDLDGVPVLILEEHTLPLVTVFARFRGGYSVWGRDFYAAGTALPALLRYGGTRELPPDSVDEMLELYAIQTSFGGAGESISSSMNTLTEHLSAALDLWGALMTEPGFDSVEIEVWRGRQDEAIRRRMDNPSGLAFSEFNRLLYGDHPIGWEMEPSDLEDPLLSPDRFRKLHARIVCRENLVLGVTGDVAWGEVGPLLERLVSRMPHCEGEMPPSPAPEIRREPGVYLIEKDLEQSVVVMAHATDVHLADEPAYFAATIGNSILGGGGFASRILSRVRTEEGYAYSASSLWTMPRRYDGLLGAITRTRPENTVPAIKVILETMAGLRDAPPEDDEVRTAVERVVNGFVFNFETAGQIVSRTMFYLAQDLPQDWLQRYMDGVIGVTPAAIHAAFAQHLRPDEMMILVVGDPERIGLGELERLGKITRIEVPNGR